MSMWHTSGPQQIFAGPPCRAQITLHRTGSVPDAIDALLLRPVALAVEKALHDHPEAKRLADIAGQRDGARKTAAVAQAALDELAAKRRQAELNAEPDLARRLRELDGLIAEQQTALADAAEDAKVLGDALAKGDAAIKEIIEGASFRAAQAAADALAQRRAVLWQQVADAAGAHLDELLGLAYALEMAGKPSVVAELLRGYHERHGAAA